MKYTNRVVGILLFLRICTRGTPQPNCYHGVWNPFSSPPSPKHFFIWGFGCRQSLPLSRYGKNQELKSLYGVLPGLRQSLQHYDVNITMLGEKIWVCRVAFEQPQPSIVSFILSFAISCYLLMANGALGSYIRFDETLLGTVVLLAQSRFA